MSLHKRYGGWHLSLYDRNGKRIRRSLKTKDRRLAEQYHDELKAKLWKKDYTDETPDVSWNEAAIAYLKASQHKRSFANIQRHVTKLREYLGGSLLKDINMSTIERIKEHRLNEGVSAATVNRMLEVLRAMLNTAVNREWIAKTPKITMLQEPKYPPRWLTQDEESRLMAELPDHLRAMAKFSLCTGLREQNVVRLKWSRVDLNRRCAWVFANEAKAGQPIAVPLNSEALAVLREQQGQHPEFVFVYKGKPVTRANNSAWVKALKRARIRDFTWHSLRSTWASRHIMSGTSAYDLQHLGGWAGQAMVRRYAALSAEHLADVAENVSEYGQSSHDLDTEDESRVVH